jgi:hypothetical protein
MCFSQPKSNAAKDTTPDYVAPPDSEEFTDGVRTKKGGGTGTGTTVRSGAPPFGITGNPLPNTQRRTSAALGL